MDTYRRKPYGMRSPSEKRKHQRMEISRAEQSNISSPANSRVTLNSLFSMNGPGLASSCDIESLLSSDFMWTTDNAHILTCIALYIEHMENDYLTFMACFVCTKNLKCGGMHFVPFEEIPYCYLLRLVKTHYAHKLYDGFLVNESSVQLDPECRTYICRDCYQYLKHAKLPPLSLANDIWLGEVPIVLDILSLLEKVLIARYFSATYIVKLYPKSQKGRQQYPNMLYNTLKGNMFAHALSPTAVASMAVGNKLPHKVDVLPSLIAVAFVGPNKCLAHSFPEILHIWQG